jgi:hypothetical protein
MVAQEDHPAGGIAIDRHEGRINLLLARAAPF